MAYKLPNEIVPDGFIHLCVAIPNRDEYIRAFLASYAYLSRWNAWEITGDDSGKRAALFFLMAYNETVENWTSCEIGEDDMATTIVNNYVTCGGDGSPCQVYVETAPTVCVIDGRIVYNPGAYDITEPEPDEFTERDISEDENPPMGLETWDDYDSVACNVANQVYAYIILMLDLAERLTDVGAVLLSIVSIVITKVPSGALKKMLGDYAYNLAVRLAAIGGVEEFFDELVNLRAEVEASKSDIICLLYTNRHNVPQAFVELYAKMLDIFTSALSTYVENTSTWDAWLDAWLLEKVLKISLWNSTENWFGLQSEFLDCSECLSNSFDWTENSGDAWCNVEPMVFDVYNDHIDYDGQISKGSEYGSYEWVATATNEEQSIPEFSGKVVTFTNTQQDQGKTIIVNAIYGDNQNIQVVVENGSSGNLNCSAIEVKSVTVKIQLAIYNAPCPQACSGSFAWSAV